MQRSRRRRRVDARTGYDLWAEDYDRTPNPVVAMDSRHALGLLDARPGAGVLDLGCGTGRYLDRLRRSGARPVGTDFSLGMLRVACRRVGTVALVGADLQRGLPFAGARFDAALCSLVGEHLAGLHRTMRDTARALRPGGRLVFTVYHPDLAAAGKESARPTPQAGRCSPPPRERSEDSSSRTDPRDGGAVGVGVGARPAVDAVRARQRRGAAMP